GLAELSRLGWIREVGDADRYRELSTAYLAAVKEKKRNGESVTALVVSPTHAEADRITGTVRAALKAEGKLEVDRTFAAWAPVYWTTAQKADPTNYDAGDLEPIRITLFAAILAGFSGLPGVIRIGSYCSSTGTPPATRAARGW